ncbi:MAG: type II secretion system protein [Anaerohalosphaera sp.]|nr:type II secretion system protein [Anaerohalosphaera sp.]
MEHRTKAPAAKRAFTLIELLVVISIIALLLAILMPALGMVKEKAKALVCSTNNRTLCQAYQLYLADYDDKFVPYNDVVNAGTNLWMNSISDTIDDVKANRFCPAAPESKVEEGVGRRGDYRKPWGWSGSTGLSYGSYAINGWLYGPDDPWASQFPNLDFEKYTDVTRLSEVPVFSDGIWVDSWPRDVDDFQAQIITNPEYLKTGYYIDGMNQNMGRVCIDRHGMKISISFFDGHAELVKLEDLWTLQWHKNFNVRRDISFR